MHNLTCLLFCGAALGVVTLPCTSRAQAVNEKIFHNVNKTTGSVRDTATDVDQIYFMQPQAFRAGYGSAVGFRGVFQDQNNLTSESVRLAFVDYANDNLRPGNVITEATYVLPSGKAGIRSYLLSFWLPAPVSLPTHSGIRATLPPPNAWPADGVSIHYQNGNLTRIPVTKPQWTWRLVNASSVILPAASRTAIGNSNNIFGSAYHNQRYHQVHTGKEVGSARTFKGHAFRPGTRTDAAVTRTIQIRMGHTTRTPATLTTSFASNITSTQTLVLNKTVTMPTMVPSTTPSVFAIKVPWTSTWAWSGASGQNLLYEYRCSNTNSVAYYPNAVSGNTNVSRMWGTGPTATTGTLGLNYGVCIAFEYAAPSGNVILPAASRTAIGNSNNVFGSAYHNQRYHQVHTGKEVGSARTFKAHAFRPGTRTDAAVTRTIQIRMGHTTRTPATLTTSFASNITSTQTLVLNKTVTMPTMVPSTVPSVFKLKVPWSSTWAWSGASGQNLLYEYRCSNTNSVTYFPNAVSGNANVSRMWGTGPTATTGTIGRNYGVCIAFEYAASSSNVQTFATPGSTLYLGGLYEEGAQRFYVSSTAYGPRENLFGAESPFPDPTRGDTFGLSLSHAGFKNKLAIPILSVGYAPPLPAPFGTLLVNPALLFVLPPANLDAKGDALMRPLPLVRGITLAMQTMFLDAKTLNLRLSDAARLTAR